MSETIGGRKVQVNQFQILFTSKKITAYGGFSLLAKFNALGAYPKVLSFLLMLLAGGKRFSHILYLGESKDLLAGLFGVRRLPKASSTLTRFFGNIKTWKAIESFHEKLWPFLLNVISWDKIKENDLTFDSHVAVRFGKQAGAKIGYNIKKPGRPSHHPLAIAAWRGFKEATR